MNSIICIFTKQRELLNYSYFYLKNYQLNFRVITRDNAEFLLLADSDVSLEEWVTKLHFHAQLSPSMQLLSYDNHKVFELTCFNYLYESYYQVMS